MFFYQNMVEYALRDWVLLILLTKKENRKMEKINRLFVITCQGYETVYVLAPSFDEARVKWIDNYINADDDGTPVPEEERIFPMPDSISYLDGVLLLS